jgi:glutamate-1-semialdehyde 2,1-aminomutase
MEGLDTVLSDAGIPHSVFGLPSMFGIILGTDREPADYREFVQGVDAPLYRQMAMEMVDRGVILHPDGREPWFMSYSHDEQVVAETLQIFEDSVKAVKQGI